MVLDTVHAGDGIRLMVLDTVHAGDGIRLMVLDTVHAGDGIRNCNAGYDLLEGWYKVLSV